MSLTDSEALEVERIVKRILGNSTATIAAQQDGTLTSDGYRVLNFRGSGVVVSHDAANRRVNVDIAGAGSAVINNNYVSAAGNESVFDNGTSASGPANWYLSSFSHTTGWSASLQDSSGLAYATPPSGAVWVVKALGTQPSDERFLFYRSITLPSGTLVTASLQLIADNFIEAVYINGHSETVNSSLDGVAQTIAIPLAHLIPGGANAVGIQLHNKAAPAPNAARLAYRLDVQSVSSITNVVQVALRGSGNKTTTSSTFTPVDSTNLPLSMTLAVGDIVRCTLGCQASVSGNGGAIDFRVVQPTLGTTRTNASAVNGATLWGSTARTPLLVQAIFVAAEAGSHTFQPLFLNSGGSTTTINNNSGTALDDTEILFTVEKMNR